MDKKPKLSLPPRETISADLHPISTRRYTLVTPMITRLVSVAVEWIKNGVTGGLVIGDPRRGKTKLRRLLATVLPTWFPRILVFSMIAQCYANPSERVFFGDLLKAFKHAMQQEGTAAQRRDRLMETIVTAVQASGQGRVVLLIDQAHYLLEMHYHWLVDVHDVLSERGIELFVFFFGQPELMTVYEELQRAGKTQITGRFMMDRVRFYGIRSLNDMKVCLDAYDTKTQYPEGTEWSFTRYYFPQAFERGWRLADHANDFWKAFDEVRRQGAVASSLEIPMQYLVRTVERFFLEAQDAGNTDPIISHEQLIRIVSATLFAALLRDEGEDPDTAAPIPTR